MKSIIIAAAIALASTSAFAGATLDGPGVSPSNGSATGKSSSSYTGNGDVIGGNGTSGGIGDQTTTPGSRPELKQAYGVMNGNANGLGSNNGNGSTGNNGSHR
jgi:hypothetical protein